MNNWKRRLTSLILIAAMLLGNTGILSLAETDQIDETYADELSMIVQKPADPVIDVSVSGTTMTATWDAVDGAASYVYSLRNMTDDVLVRDHVAVNGRLRVRETLEAGKQYRLAVGAVPEGVDIAIPIIS